MNNIGDTWHRFDLHVHTPESIETCYGDKNSPETWEKFCSAIEELDDSMSILGINDYWSVEGYRRMRKFKKRGRLENVELLIPVIELRLSEGRDLKKLQNFHVAFSPDIEVETIESLFINELKCRVRFGEEDRDFKLDENSLISYGKALHESGILSDETSPKHDGDFRKIGYKNFTVSLDLLNKILKRVEFRGRYLTFFGYSETKVLDSKGFQGLEKQALLSADAAFLASPKADSFEQNRRKLNRLSQDTPLIHSSDSHRFNDGKEETRYLGKGNMWVRCSPNFESFRFAFKKHSSRLSYGPPSEFQTKKETTVNVLSSLEVSGNRSAGTKDAEPKLKFSYGFEINPGYVVILGNKGQGKSALADWISIGVTKGQNRSEQFAESFSFLNSKRYSPSRKSSKECEQVSTHWLGKEPVRFGWRKDEEPSVNRVDYYPQSYLEKLCSADPDSISAEALENIIRDLLFRRLSEEKRQTYGNFDGLLDYEKKAQQVGRSSTSVPLSELQQNLLPLFKRMLELESWELDKQESRISERLAEIKAPESSLSQKSTIIEPISSMIESASKSRTRWLSHLTDLDQSLEAFTHLFKIEQDVNSRLDSTNQALDFVAATAFGLERFEHFTDLRNEAESLRRYVSEWTDKISSLNDTYKSTIKANQIEVKDVISNLADLSSELNERLSAIQDETEEQTKIVKLRTGDTDPSNDTWSLRGISAFRTELADKNQQIEKILVQISESGRATISYLSAAAQEINTLFRGIMREFNLEEVEIDVKVELVDRLAKRDLASALKRPFKEDALDDIFERRNGIIAGGGKSDASESVRYLKKVVDFAKDVERKNGFSANSSLDVRKLLEDLTSFESLDIKFELTLDEKKLDKLSPGERGLVLLLFILYLDASGNVLVLDQPEDNLDNETIRQLLVPALESARSKRQLIVVTHNANIGVLGDPDQVICCNFEDHNFTVRSGSLSEDWVRNRVLELLEGAREAFQMRSERYGLR